MMLTSGVILTLLVIIQGSTSEIYKTVSAGKNSRFLSVHTMNDCQNGLQDCKPVSGGEKLRSITSLYGTARAARILWTLDVEKDPATPTATVLSVPLSAAPRVSVRTTSLQEEGRLLLTYVLRRLIPFRNQTFPSPDKNKSFMNLYGTAWNARFQ